MHIDMSWSCCRAAGYNKFVDEHEYIYKYEEELLSALRHLEEFKACKDWTKLIFKDSAFFE